MTDHLHAVFARQHQASRDATSPPDAAERRRWLDVLGRLMRDNADAMTAAISEDFGGRSPSETRLLELLPTLNAIKHARRSVARWMKPDRRHVGLMFRPASASVHYQPLGVVGIVSPWNYPLLLSVAPLVDALAAGNRVMIKPSELTPRFAELLVTILAQGFDRDRVAVITGGVEVARGFTGLAFDHLLFTGSTSVGHAVMRAAADNLTPVTLELGGKSPAIVCPDYDLARAARSIAFGKFLNAGQTCIAPDYALVPEGKVDRFAELVMAHVRRAYPTLAGNPDYSGILSDRQRTRLDKALSDAKAAGAVVRTHGAAAGPGQIAPMVVTNVPADNILMTEEIFGPVLPIVGYRGLDDALARVRAGDRPLALYPFTDDATSRRAVLDGTVSGGVTLNGTLLHVAQDALPFGGVGPSGMGAYHGRDGFMRFSHARAVYKPARLIPFERMGPPWGGLARAAERLLAR